MIKSVLVCTMIVMAAITLSGGQISFAANTPTDQDLDEESEVMTEDHRHEFTPTILPKVGKHVVPHLGQLRAQYAKETGLQEVPVPGGLGSGTLYHQGKLQALYEGTLRTQMLVYPEGMLTLPNNWLFTTATNRTEKTVEVVGIFFGTGQESIGVFDWSCLPDWPCPNGEAGPSWQWTYPLASQPCYVVTEYDPVVNLTINWFTYQNQSKSGQTQGAKPPLWHNTVKFWNYCTHVWDLVYMHTFRVDQKDCSLESFGCGWWGPIIETFFPDPQPPIKPLGFRNTRLSHDRDKSDLSPDETYFVSPAYPWQTYYLHPNDSWIVGP